MFVFAQVMSNLNNNILVLETNNLSENTSRRSSLESFELMLNVPFDLERTSVQKVKNNFLWLNVYQIK